MNDDLDELKRLDANIYTLVNRFKISQKCKSEINRISLRVNKVSLQSWKVLKISK